MIPELPTLASPLLSRALILGCSTGFMSEHRSDWTRLVDEAAAISSIAAELSALSGPELPGLIAYLRTAPRLPFVFLSVHAPSKDRVHDERALVQELSQVPVWVDAIVVHPDTIAEPSLYRPLGRRLTLENMDSRKDSGQTAVDLAALYAALPDARLCLDVAHAKDVDPTLTVADELLQRFSSRLSHVHVSSLDESQSHVPLRPEDETSFAPLLARCRDVPWILEAPPPL